MFQSIADTVEYPQIPITDLVPFTNHKFPLYTGKKMDDLVESIKLHGIILAVVVRNITGTTKYEILSGHNRTEAAKLAGLDSVPCYIVDIDDDEAELFVVETNMFQRSMEELSYSVRAEIIYDWYNANKKQGFRSDRLNDIFEYEKQRNIEENETSFHSGTKSTFPQNSVEKFDLSKTNIFRYLRINQLIPEMKKILDDGNNFSFLAGVDLSFLKKEHQNYLSEIFHENEYLRCTTNQAAVMKDMAARNKLKTKEDFYAFLTGEKKSSNTSTDKKVKITLKPKFLSQFFAPSMTEKSVNDEIEKAVILRQATIPTLLSEYGIEEEPDTITEKAIKFYLENHQ